MKRFILSLTAWLCALTASADGNQLLLADSVVFIGAANQYLYVEMQNPGIQPTALQFDVQLPDGLTFIGAELAGETLRTSDHAVVTGEPTDGHYRIVVYSPTNAPCTGVSGTLLRIAVSADASMTAGRYPVTLSQTELAAPGTFVRAAESVTTQIAVAMPTGIRAVLPTDVSSEAYDLVGRRASCAYRGLRIVNGRKVLK